MGHIPANESDSVSSGIPALDSILHGGFAARSMHLIEGTAGTGKTTLGMHFLLDGQRAGERGLYITLSETEIELQQVARSHGWDLAGIDFHELVEYSESLDGDSQYTMFEPSEVELSATTRAVLDRVVAINPRRVVFDSLSELRLLTSSPLRFRRQILALKQFFLGRDCTVLLIDSRGTGNEDLQLHSIAHAVIRLEHAIAEFGGDKRRLRVSKFRGRDYLSGFHDYRIVTGGMEVFPRFTSKQIVASNSSREHGVGILSGNESLDALLGEGMTPGTSALLLGPSGVGKSTCATLYAYSAAMRGERAVLFIFDETLETLIERAAGLGMDLAPLIDGGLLHIERLDPGDITPGQFASSVRAALHPDEQGRQVSVVVIDSLNGYLSSMPEEKFLTIQLHELLSYLADLGIVTFIVVAQHGMFGGTMDAPFDASYLADTVILFRYFEAGGRVRQAISIVKKRTGGHERTIREFSMANGIIEVGKPLSDFQGILAGTPQYVGKTQDLLDLNDGQ